MVGAHMYKNLGEIKLDGMSIARTEKNCGGLLEDGGIKSVCKS